MWKSNKSVYTRGPLFVPHLIQRSSALRVDAIQPPPICLLRLTSLMA